jgi:hypothetical protein
MEHQVNMDAAYAVSDKVVARDIVGELVIVPLVSGVGDIEDALYSLSEHGRAIWDRLDGHTALRHVVADLSQEYDAPPGQIEQDVRGLVEELVRRSLLVEVPRD